MLQPLQKATTTLGTECKFPESLSLTDRAGPRTDSSRF